MNQENGFPSSWSPNQPNSWNMTNNALAFDIQSSTDSTKGTVAYSVGTVGYTKSGAANLARGH